MRKWKTWMRYINLWTFPGLHQSVFVQWFTAAPLHLREGGRNATWNISLRDNLAKQNNANKQEKDGKNEGKHFKEAPSSFLQTCRQYFCRRWSFLIISARNNTGITDAGPLLSPGLLNCGETRQTFHHFSTDALIPFFEMTENEGLLKEKWVFFIWMKSTKTKPQSAGSL